jgi:hypothetical protein
MLLKLEKYLYWSRTLSYTILFTIASWYDFSLLKCAVISSVDLVLKLIGK